MLSAYRLMWMVVMFDLPVVSKAERAAATRFRLDLLDLGFERSQLSIYMRYCTSATQIDTYCRKVELLLPAGGKVHILQFTDKQYERIISYEGGRRQPEWRSPDQFNLF